MSPLAGCRSDALGSSRGPFPVRMAETSGATSRRVETSARAYPTWSAYPSASQAAGRPGTVDRTATWASSCVSTTSRPLGVSRPNAVGSSTTRSPVAVPADPVGPSVVAATGAAPDPAGRPSSASASGAVDGSQHQDPRRGARPLLAQRGHGAVDHGRVLGEPCGRHGAGHDRVLAAAHPQRRHRHPRGGRPGPDRSLRLDLPAGAGTHQVVLQPGDPVAAVEVVDPVAHVDLRRGPQRARRARARLHRGHRGALRRGRRVRARLGRDDVDDRLTDLEPGDPQGPGRGVRVELPAPRGGRAVGDRGGIRRLVPSRRPRRHDGAARRRSQR